MTAIRLVAPCQRFQFRAAAIPASLKTSVKACHRYSDCRSRFADKFHSVHLRRLPKSKIGNPKSKLAHAPLAQLAEQVTLNHWVAGSIPARCNFLLVEARPELVEMGADEVSSINIFLRDRHAAADAKSTAGYLQSRRGLLSLILV